VLAEAQRRQLMRQSAVTQQNQPPMGSVYDDVIRSMMARQPPQGPPMAGMTPPPSAPPAAPQTPQNFKPMGMAGGGEVDDDEEDEEDDNSGDGDGGDVYEMPLKTPLKPAGPFRAAPAKTSILQRRNPAVWDEDLEAAGKRWGVDPDLGRAVIERESGGDPNAVSSKGATGVMQLMPSTAAGLGVTDMRNPSQNINAGMRYLRQLIDRYDGDIPKALAAYNWGLGNIDKGGPLPQTVQDYASGVLKRYSQIKGKTNAQLAEDLTPLTPAKPTQAFTNPWDWELAQVGEAPAAGTPSDDDDDLQPDPQTEALLSQLPSVTRPAAQQAAAQPTAQSQAATPAAATAPYDPYNREALEKARDAYQDVYYGYQPKLSPDQQNMRNEIQRLLAAAKKREKPTVWDFLENLGLGMASTPSRNWGQSLAGGLAGMAKGVTGQEEQARKDELALLGVSSKLDDQMRLEQGKVGDAVMNQARYQQQAINAAAKEQLAAQNKSFDDLRRAPGSIYTTKEKQPAPDFTWTDDPHTPGYGIWSPPGTRKVTQDLLPYVRVQGINEQTQKPFEVGEAAPYSYITAAQKKALEQEAAREKHTQTQAEFNTAYGVANTLRSHPEIPWPVGPDGQPRDPASLRLNDLPNTPQLQSEGLWRARIAKEQWSPILAKAIIADPYAPPDLVAQAKNIQAQDVTQAGRLTAERTKQQELAKAAELQQQAAVLTPVGQKAMAGVDPVGKSLDSLIGILGQDKYYSDRSPLTIAKPWALYRMGIGSGGEVDDINRNMSNLALNGVRAAMPYATASRNMKWIDMVLTHLPNPPFDSPANMREKLINARLGLLGIEASTLRWDRKGAGANDPGPAITPDRAQTYIKLAAGGRDVHTLPQTEQAKVYQQAMKWAQEAGWTIPK
jgi:hypothetical protein